jgi:hypothetical protein
MQTRTTHAASPAGRRRRRGASLAVCLAVAALVGPLAAPASALQKAIWGPTRVNGVSQFPIYRDLGVDVYQTAINWSLVAKSRPAHSRDPRDPAYQWPADLDFALQQANANHMRVLVMLIGTPAWANGGRTFEYAPRQMSDFRNFAVAASRRYPGVKLWMIWGEPSRVANWKPLVGQDPALLDRPLSPVQRAAPRRYARLLDAGYSGLKFVSRKNTVIGGNTFSTGNIRSQAWIRNLRLPNGRPPRMDMYGHNPFSLRAPDLKKPASPLGVVDFSDLGRFQKDVDRFLGRPLHKKLRLFLSEFTIPTDARDSEFNFHVTRSVQAKWIRDAFRVAKQINAYGLGWIHLYDEPPNPNGDLVSHGGLITADGQKKAGYFAFKRG